MQGSQSATIKVLQSPRDDQKVEVALETAGGIERVVLRYSTWTEGLGWCGQKTIRLDVDQLDDLHRALTVARHRMGRKLADAGEFKDSGRIIQLPTLG